MYTVANRAEKYTQGAEQQEIKIAISTSILQFRKVKKIRIEERE